MSATGSYPYLAVSQNYGVKYAVVLRLADALDTGEPMAPYLAGKPEMWIVATCSAWMREQRRRRLVLADHWPRGSFVEMTHAQIEATLAGVRAHG